MRRRRSFLVLAAALVFLPLGAGRLAAQPGAEISDSADALDAEPSGTGLPDLVSAAANEATRRATAVSSARRSLEETRASAPGIAWLEDLSLSLTGSVAGSFSGSPEPSFSGSASLSVPFLPQLSASASIDTAARGSASLSVRPLVATTPGLDYQRDLDKASLALERAADAAQDDGVAALFAAAKADLTRLTALAARDLALVELRRVEALFDAGFASRDEADERRREAADAEAALDQAEVDLRFALEELAFVTGIETIDGPGLAQEGQEYLDEVVGILAEAERTGRTTQEPPELVGLRIDASYLQAKIERTPAITPNLSISASVDYPTPTFRASVSLSASPSSFIDDAREPYRSQLETTLEQIAQAERTAAYQAERALLSLDLAHRRHLDAQASLADATSRLAQDELLLEQGSVLQITVTRSRAAVELARQNLATRSLELLEAYVAYISS